jgi:multiple sugar transport system substrate-binding protein
MFKKLQTLVAILAIAGFILTACSTPTAQIIEKTVVVTQEVQTTVEVEVEKTVEVEVVRTVEAPAGEKTKVVFYHIFGSGASRDIFDKLIADFNLASDKYVVEPVYVDFWTYEQKVLADVAAGTPPDVIMSDQTRTGQRAAANQIIPLDDFIERDQVDMSVFWAYPLADVAYQGQTWGIPYGPDTRLLFYNKDHFTEAGLDPEKAPANWDELWEAAHKLDQGSGADITRVGFNPWWGNSWVLPILHTTGVQLVDPDGPKFFFTAPEVVETATWYKTWVDYYGKETLDVFASGFGTGAQDPFMSGQVSMIIQVQGYIGELLKFAPDLKWGVAMIPAKTTPSSWGAGFDLEIPNGSKNTEGAWEFIKYLTAKETEVKFAVASGWMPSRMDAASDPELTKLPGWDIVLKSMEVTRSRPFILEAPAWYGPLITAFQEVWDGVKTPEQALADAQAAVEQEVANYKSLNP